MKGDGGGQPGGAITDAVNRSFGIFSDVKEIVFYYCIR
jgi:hypothetical protein